MGHAGAIITGSSGTADNKIRALEAAGVAVATRPIDIPKLMKERLG
jgi:succinyl-CoA synthetase alpha subunit